MTSTAACNAMNAVYEVTKGMATDELVKALAILKNEQPRGWRILAHCCNETIRRKCAGIWK